MAERSIEHELILAAAEMVRTSQGQRFVKAFAAKVEEARDELVMAPPDYLAYAQGVARQSTVLLRQIMESVEKAPKIIAAEETAAAKKQAANRSTQP